MHERKPGIVLVALLLIVFANPLAAQESIAGHWEGKIMIQEKAGLDVLIDLERLDDGKWKGDIDIPLQGAKDLPLVNISFADGKTSFEIEGVPGKPVFSGTLSEDGSTITGNFSQGGQTFPFTLKRGAAPPPETAAKPESEILKDISDRIKATMPDWHVPGLAIAIVKNGKIIFAEGFGVRNVETKEPVTADTLFAIGSSTKAFTATLMGIAVDDGLVKWDDPIRKYLPTFKLSDEFATIHMSPRDLLTHRSGLPRHDLTWYGSPFSRKELFERLQYLEPTEDFRTVFQYQNLMFMTAGYLEEALYGKSWETLIKEKILDPLGMKKSNFSVADLQKTTDFAMPYEWKREDKTKGTPETLKIMPFRNIDAIGPAGSINSNVKEMANWVMVNLNDGKFENITLTSEPAIGEIHSPQIVVRGGIFSQLLTFPEAPYLMYGMGWMIQPYRGHRLIHHGGNIDGFSAMVSFMPDAKLGVVILSNLDGNLMVDSLMFEVYDRLLGLDPIDWNGRFAVKYAQVMQAVEQSQSIEDEILRKKDTKPSHPIKDYPGNYEHPAYGVLQISLEGDKLKASMNGITSKLDHFHYDVFAAADDPVKGTKLTFENNLRGDINSVSIPLEQGIDPIEFDRVAPAELRQPQFLEQFTGEYDLLGISIYIKSKNNQLIMTVPGQPAYTLEPYREMQFDIKDLEGFSVQFRKTGDRVTEVILIQPNGVLTAKRKN